MWLPIDLPKTGPRYLALVQALERDVASGLVPPLAQLPPQRDLAFRLGLSVGTVTRAYAIAAQRGLVAGEVGRGTFVCATTTDRPEDGFFRGGAGAEGLIDLSLNVPPLCGEAAKLGSAMRSLAGAPDMLAELLRYLPHQGLSRHRQALARWIARSGFQSAPDPACLVLCNGAQHAMSVVLNTVCRPGDIVLAEALTYAGFKAAAAAARLDLRGVPMDEDGLIPDALDRACAETGARLLFIMPTLQNPTGVTMTAHRREGIARVAKRRGLLVLEDDVYGFLHPTAPPPLTTLLPEGGFYIGSFSKSLAPGLRMGFVLAPKERVADLVLGVRATAWMASGIMAEVVARWTEDGTAEEIAAAKRAEATRRRAIAVDLLGNYLSLSAGDAASFHVWLRVPEAPSFAAAAAARGVAVTPLDAVATDAAAPSGVRLCLGAPTDDLRLRRGLGALAELLRCEAQVPSVV